MRLGIIEKNFINQNINASQDKGSTNMQKSKGLHDINTKRDSSSAFDILSFKKNAVKQTDQSHSVKKESKIKDYDEEELKKKVLEDIKNKYDYINTHEDNDSDEDLDELFNDIMHTQNDQDQNDSLKTEEYKDILETNLQGEVRKESRTIDDKYNKLWENIEEIEDQIGTDIYIGGNNEFSQKPSHKINNEATCLEKLKEVLAVNKKNQPSYTEMKNRLIFDSYKPMRLITVKDPKKETKHLVDLKKLDKINILQKEATLLKMNAKKNCSRKGTYQGIRFLEYSKEDIIQICCPYSSYKVFGFVTKESYDLKDSPKIKCGLVELSNLDKECISMFPKGRRIFPERLWRLISNTTYAESDDKLLNTEEDILELEFEHENSQKQVIQIAYCIKDFNFQNFQNPLEFDGFDYYNWEISSNKVQVPFLSVGFNDIIITTRVPDENGWLEGYKASDPEMNIKLIHQECIDFLKI
ncbi:unnamed protein product [Moneuplotes crassus]|uniref:Uncharacterized protein n=1 Tax=Euplotes crassus TaxID=5936 RepID=A0AAD1UDN6_EUPCR|nr:unnamed protein product [Moneuplotes crassus]